MRSGCRKSFCFFVHPTDPEWARAQRIPWQKRDIHLDNSNAGPSYRHDKYKERDRDSEDIYRHRHRSRSPRREKSSDRHSRRNSYAEKAYEHEYEHERAREHRAGDNPERRPHRTRTRTHSQSSIASSAATPVPPSAGPPPTSADSVLSTFSTGENSHIGSLNTASTGPARASLFSGNVPSTSGPSRQNSISVSISHCTSQIALYSSLHNVIIASRCHPQLFLDLNSQHRCPHPHPLHHQCSLPSHCHQSRQGCGWRSHRLHHQNRARWRKGRCGKDEFGEYYRIDHSKPY